MEGTEGEGRRVKMKNMSALAFFGVLAFIMGLSAIGTLVAENWKIKWRVWGIGEQAGAIGGGVGVILGVLFVLFGCGGSQMEPADPIHVEVIRPESDFEPTMAVYAYLAVERAAVAECEAARVPFEEGRTIRAAARQEMQLLCDEFAAYVEFGEGGPYCGPVCEEMQKFLFEGDGAEVLLSCEE